VIDNVAVDPSHQRTGVGRALLEHADATARVAGLEWIHLYTHELMTENRALYSRIGYHEYDPNEDQDSRLVYLRKRVSSP
jgi:ribosomal protein S18 acetylase RimI-like enzyme